MIFAVYLHNVWRFNVSVGGYLACDTVKGRLGHPLKAVHSLVHFAHHHVPPATVVEVYRAVIVLEKMRVYRLGIIIYSVYQRSAVGKDVSEGTRGSVGDTNIKSAYLALCADVVSGEDNIISAVLVYHGRRPDSEGRAAVGEGF